MSTVQLHEARERRRRRAACAERLLAKAPEAAPSLDWDALDHAPPWLGVPEPMLAAFQRRVGAVLCAPALRLWIDGPRLAAARAALGDPFLHALLAAPDFPDLHAATAAPPRLDAAERIGALLQAAGGGVLLASLPDGPLRSAAGAAMAPAVPLLMGAELAQALVARTMKLIAQSEMERAA